MLRHRQIFAKNSSKWGDPRAKLLDGPVWEQVKATVLASLSLPATPGEQLAARAELLDATYRQVAAALPRNTRSSSTTPAGCTWPLSNPRPNPPRW